MQRIFVAIVAVLTLTGAACGADADSQSDADEPLQASAGETAEPARTPPDETDPDDSTAPAAPADDSTAPAAPAEPADGSTAPAEPDNDDAAVAEPDSTTTTVLSDPAATLRAEAKAAINDLLSVDAPAAVTVDEIACVAATFAAAIDTARLEAAVAALDTPSAGLLPAGLVTPAERGRILDTVVGCVPWTQLLIGLALTADTPLEVLACAEATAADSDTERAAAELLLFGGDEISAYDLLPPDCVPAVTVVDVVGRPTSAAGRLTAAQLASAGVSAESAACVAAEIDAAVAALDPGADLGAESGPDIFAAMFSCLTPDELALLDASDSAEG